MHIQEKTYIRKQLHFHNDNNIGKLVFIYIQLSGKIKSVERNFDRTMYNHGISSTNHIYIITYKWQTVKIIYE